MKKQKYTVINGEVKEVTFVEKRKIPQTFTSYMIHSYTTYSDIDREYQNIYTYKQGNLNVEIPLEDDVIFNEKSTANLYKLVLEQDKRFKDFKDKGKDKDIISEGDDMFLSFTSCSGGVGLEITKKPKKPWYKFWK
jgi:hypothetical protein